MENEIWKPIPGHEGYHVSNMGRVWGPKFAPKAGAINSRGYRSITLVVRGYKRGVRIHQLVMLAFVGPCPKGQEVNHINGIKADNRLENLEYVTRSENIRHAYRIGLKQHKKGSLNGCAKLDERDVIAIRLLCDAGFDSSYIGRKFGVSHRTIHLIRKNQAWTHVDAAWKEFRK